MGIAIAQIFLPCDVWRWPVAVVVVATGTFALLVVAPREREVDMDPTARGVAIWLSQAWIISGIIAGSGLVC